MRPCRTVSTTTTLFLASVLASSLLALTSAQQTTPSTTTTNIYPTEIFTGTRPTYPSSQIIFIDPPTPFPSLEASILPPASSSSDAAATTYRIICAAPTIWTSNYATPSPTSPTSCPYGNGGLTVTQAASTYEATWRADPGQSANVVRCEIQGSTSAVCRGSSAGAAGFVTSMVGVVVRGVAVTAGNTVSVSSGSGANGIGAGVASTPAVTSVTATSNRVGTSMPAVSSALGSSLSSAAASASASASAASTVGAGASTGPPVITSYGPGTGTAVNSAFTPTSTPNAGARDCRVKTGVLGLGVLVAGLGLFVV